MTEQQTDVGLGRLAAGLLLGPLVHPRYESQSYRDLWAPITPVGWRRTRRLALWSCWAWAGIVGLWSWPLAVLTIPLIMVATLQTRLNSDTADGLSVGGVDTARWAIRWARQSSADALHAGVLWVGAVVLSIVARLAAIGVPSLVVVLAVPAVAGYLFTAQARSWVEQELDYLRLIPRRMLQALGVSKTPELAARVHIRQEQPDEVPEGHAPGWRAVYANVDVIIPSREAADDVLLSGANRRLAELYTAHLDSEWMAWRPAPPAVLQARQVRQLSQDRLTTLSDPVTPEWLEYLPERIVADHAEPEQQTTTTTIDWSAALPSGSRPESITQSDPSPSEEPPAPQHDAGSEPPTQETQDSQLPELDPELFAALADGK